jgi:undecaprenyl diphosphate synthase
MAQSKEASPAGLRHVAIIMDGNRRWAEKKGLPALAGHRAGAEAVRRTIKACRNQGIHYLTLYAFSMENWQRPRSEVLGLMGLLRDFLKKNIDQLMEEEIRLRAIGRLELLPMPTRKVLEHAIQKTAGNSHGELILAVSYGGRTEIVDAAKKLAVAAAKGEIDPAAIDETQFAGQLYAPDVPDPDLLIRTSGEFRLSNFLLWQLSYTEIVVLNTLWPDFEAADLDRAIHEYQQRQRRFGRR